MGSFLESGINNKYILVITEYLSRWCIVATIPDIYSTMDFVVLQQVVFNTIEKNL